MEMLAALTEEVRAELFTTVVRGEVDISGLVSASPTIDFIGITFSEELKFVLAFLTADEASGDSSLTHGLAASWTIFSAGFQLVPADARVIKFFRAGATADDLYIPERWPIPKPFTIWHLEAALTQAVRVYTDLKPDVKQFFFMPQNGALEKWYARIERSFCGTASGKAFQNISRPASGEGGFHGFQYAQNN